MTIPVRSNTLPPQERKRLGQFFTGVRLARALATLSKAQSAKSILDPMAGSGDMFVACTEIGAFPTLIGAIELDPVAAHLCRSRTAKLATDVRVEVGSAFEPHSWNSLPDIWDLVITNPPYVRYQSGSSATTGRVDVPSAETIRAGLVDILEQSVSLTDTEREIFVRAASTYSGLSDLAVPSWLLSASRVRPEGRLGIVVPDTWLSRDYAAPILCVLRRFFEIEHVVIDADASWFEDALLRTTLVVARRVPDKMSALGPGRHLVVHIPKAAGTPGSIVGAAFPGDDPDGAFAEWVGRAQHPEETPLVSEWSDELDFVGIVRHASARHQWMTSCDLEDGVVSTEELLPRKVRYVVGSGKALPLTDLAGLGWAVGQGLRTGANDFFYVGFGPDGAYRSSLLPGEDLILPRDMIRPAVRRQAELPKIGSRVLQPKTGVLALDGWAMPEDIDRETNDHWLPISGDLARLILAAVSVRYRRGNKKVPLPELSAVQTNIRHGRSWYHLPRFTARHEPELFVARVNTRTPRIYLNGGGSEQCIVDANFSTLWVDASHEAPIEPFALAALLSSSWASAVFESIGTVMGGGALKLEATHLRRVVLPKPDAEAEAALVRYGEIVAEEGPVIAAVNKIDRLVEGLVGISVTATEALRSLTCGLVATRSRRGTRNG